MNTGRLIGIVLVVIGFGITMIAGVWLALGVSSEKFDTTALVFGAFLAFIPVAVLVGFGIYMFVQGGKEAEVESTMRKQRELLDIVKSRGQVGVPELALEMKSSVDVVKAMVHELVGLQVFSGYVNWEDGVLYSSEASQLRELTKCKNCGGEITLAGKGVVVCRFCGTEYFLS